MNERYPGLDVAGSRWTTS